MTGQRFFMASELRSSSWLCIEEEEKKLQNPLLCGIFSPAKTIPFHRPNNFTWNRICIRQVLPMHSQNSHQKVIKNPSFSWKLGIQSKKFPFWWKSKLKIWNIHLTHSKMRYFFSEFKTLWKSFFDSSIQIWIFDGFLSLDGLMVVALNGCRCNLWAIWPVDTSKIFLNQFMSSHCFKLSSQQEPHNSVWGQLELSKTDSWMDTTDILWSFKAERRSMTYLLSKYARITVFKTWLKIVS